MRSDPDTISLYESPAELTPSCRIDEIVLRKLKQLGIRPARICSDEVFLRRAYLDVIGTLPTAVEAGAFLKDTDPKKRRALVDRLLQRDEFADYWAMKWCDLLRVKSEFPVDLWPNAVQAYHRWIRTSIRDNVPYDRFARSLLTASGSNFRDPTSNFYRAMQGRGPEIAARMVALTFMGARAEAWPKARLDGMAAFFSQVGYKSTGEWKEEIVYHDLTKPLGATPVFPDGKKAKIAPDRDPRSAFADWLISPRNAWFAKAIVNRVWYWLLGRGIVQEPDDIRPDNPPSNPELLAYLERAFVAAHYDLRQLFRLILTSDVYQLSPVSRSSHPQAAAQFAAYPLRRLDAEVLIDALNQITGATERYSSQIPEPFTFIPDNTRAVALADGSITSSFLEMFGRPARDTGLEAERNSRPSPAQRLHLLNSSHIRNKINAGPNIALLLRPLRNPRAVVEGLYLTILSRNPSPDEQRAAVEYMGRKGAVPRDAALDVAWSLINSSEFLYRH